MIDLHCHLLPGIDDGAPDEAASLAMARIAAQDGIRITACTPHIYPGLYENDANGIRARVATLQAKLAEQGISLQLTSGADAHMTPELLGRLKGGTAPTLNGGRYFLLEPPHHVAPPRFEDSVFDFIVSGYVPVVTHPERLTWIADHYEAFKRITRAGAWMQVTSGSLTGRFGDGAKYWGERMLDDGLVHLLATDAHSVKHRPPLLAEGRHAALKWVGGEEADRLVNERPRAILDNVAPREVAMAPAMLRGAEEEDRRAEGVWRRWFGRSRR